MLAQDTIIKNGMVRTKDSIMECPHCKSTFQKDHVRTRMRKWGKDSFYSTRHCPNCDKRILLRDDNPDIESVNTRLSKLRTYCNYCKMNGQFDEYRDVMSEILELQKQIEDMRNGEMNTKVKDRNIEINQGLEYTIEEKDKILEKFGGKVHFIYSGGGYFRIDKLDDSIKGKLMFLSQRSSDSKKLMKDAALVALKKLGQVKKQVKDAKNFMGERTFQTYEAWKRACKQIDPNVKFDGDKDICQAGKIGEWDGDKGIIYNTKDSDQDFYTVKDSKPTAKDKALKALDSLKKSIIRNNPSFDSKKTKDKISVYKYKGFTYEYDNENSNKVSFIKTPSGKVIKEYAPNAMPTITGVNGKIDAYIKQVAHDKKTKDASPADKIKDLLQNGYSLKDAILKTEKSIGRQLNAFEAAEAVAVSKKMGKTKDEEEGLYYYKQWQVYGKDGKWTATRRFLGKTGPPGRGEVKITAKSFEEAKSKIDDYIRQVGHDKKTKDIMAVGTIKEIDYKGYQIQLRRYENSVGWKILKDGSLISNGQDFYSESRAVEEAKKDIDALTKDKKMRS